VRQARDSRRGHYRVEPVRAFVTGREEAPAAAPREPAVTAVTAV